MSKIVKKSNPKIVVEIATHVYGIALSEETLKRDLKEAVEQIKRHVDNIRSADIEWDIEEICSHCGYGWEIDEETKEPVCCQKAIDEFNSQKINTK